MHEMQKFFYVLGVSHRVQGEMDFRGSFHDPDYGTVVCDLIRSEGIDFVAEEGGDHTTAAEKITNELLGPGHYLNVSPERREDHGIGDTFNGYMLTSVTREDFPVLRWFLLETEKLEEIWVDVLTRKTAARGLLICGFYHTFSVGAKLLKHGSVEGRTYVPHDKLCSHSKGTTRPEDRPKVLIFVDVLGFKEITNKYRVRVKEYQESGYSGASTTEMQGLINRFNTVLDRCVFEEANYGGIQAMLFSDCAFLVFDNSAHW